MTILMDFNGYLLDANPATTRSLGYDKAELPTLNIKDIDGRFAENNGKKLTEKRFLSDTSLPTETRYIRKDRSAFPAEVRMFPIPLHGENATLAFARDIRGRKEMEAERLKVKNLESPDVVADGLAHDYNNLLYIISGNAELISCEAPSDSVVGKYAGEIMDAVARATDVTRKLLVFSKGGKPVLKKQSVRKLIENVCSSLKMPPEILCDVHADENLRQSELDEGQIGQVLANLMNNAREAMPAGGTITVRARNVSYGKEELVSGIRTGTGKYIEISIEDQGVGIPEEHLTEIFDPYFSTKKMGIHKGQGQWVESI